MGKKPEDAAKLAGVHPSTRAIIKAIRAIPKGKVSCYRDVALAAGIANGARQVVWVLHSLSEKEKLPWHRVIRADGCIALPPSGGAAQRRPKSRLMASNPRHSCAPARAVCAAVSACGCCSGAELQAALLKSEGVEVSKKGKINMEKYGM
jgi:methylated-DNA-protein-cysteine methyltransferase-like protein